MNPKNRRLHLVLLAIIPLGAGGAFAAAPAISGFLPASGVLSSTVTITGTNFVSPATVSFNGVASTLVSVSSSTTIHATVPTTASTGAITVTDSGGSATSSSAFTVLPGAAVTPSAVGPPTSAVTLYYSGYGVREAVDVYFDTEDIAISAASPSGAGNIPITIPADARPGSHWITAVGRHSASAVQIAFTVRTNWPQFGFTPNHKSINRYENVLSPTTVGDLEEAWSTPNIGEVQSNPVVVNGIVYAVFLGANIRAFDEITGAQKWSYAPFGVGGVVFPTPAVSNGIVYGSSGDGHLYALDAVTGALKWQYLTGNIVESAPNVVNGIVYFGSDDGNVYALNATTGSLVWSFPTGGQVYSPPAVANGVLYVGSFDHNVYALNAATGAKIWLYTTSGSVHASPAIAGGLIYVGNEYGVVYALDASTGSAVWTYDTAGGAVIDSSAAAVGGAIFFGCDNGNVYSLSSSGAVRWATPLGSGLHVDGPICVANGVVYASASFSDYYGYIYALNQNTGAVLATLPSGSDFGGPIVANGAVFCGDNLTGSVVRYTPNASLSNYVAPRPDPRQLRPHHLR